MLRSAALAAATFLTLALVACPAAPPPPPPEPPKPAAPPPPPPTPPTPQVPEPAGISAGAHKAPDAPKGKGMWAVDPASTSVSFTIVSNSAGLVTGKLDNAASGAFDPKAKKGVFHVDLTKLVTTSSKAGAPPAPNPVRDANVIESFFGARPFASTPANAANAPKKPDVENSWKALTGKIASGVSTASLVVGSVEGAELAKDGASNGTVNGKLELWDSVEVPVSWPVSVEKKGDTLTVKGTAPAKFDIEKVTGSAIRKALFDNMLAAGCAHQPGIQNEVSVMLDQVTLKEQKK
jgi:hypothetical protein